MNNLLSFGVNRKSWTLLFQVFLNIISFFIGLYSILYISSIDASLGGLLLLFYVIYCVAGLILLVAAINSKVIFKEKSLYIKRILTKSEIPYENIKNIQVVPSSTFSFYFSLYKTVFPFTGLLGLGGSGFIILVLGDGKNIELPILFDMEKEKQVLQKIKENVPALNTSKLIPHEQVVEKNTSMNKLYTYGGIFILVCSIIIFVTDMVNTKNQKNLDEVVLPDGSKQFAYDFKRYPNEAEGIDYATWAIYYPSSYVATDINNYMTDSLEKYVIIKRNTCCIDIAVNLHQFKSERERDEWINIYKKPSYVQTTYGNNDYYGYVATRKEEVELGRLTKDNARDLRLYSIVATVKKDEFENSKQEVIAILESFDTDYKNLKSNKLLQSK